MRKNLIPEIAKMLGVQLGEKFKVKGEDEQTYVFTDNGLKVTFGDDIELSHIAINSAFVALVKGQDEVVKLPWTPKIGDYYWTFDKSNASDCIRWTVGRFKWENAPVDICAFKNSWVFRTEDEAEKALPAVAEEMGVYY